MSFASSTEDSNEHVLSLDNVESRVGEIFSSLEVIIDWLNFSFKGFLVPITFLTYFYSSCSSESYTESSSPDDENEPSLIPFLRIKFSNIPVLVGLTQSKSCFFFICSVISYNPDEFLFCNSIDLNILVSDYPLLLTAIFSFLRTSDFTSLI